MSADGYSSEAAQRQLRAWSCAFSAFDWNGGGRNSCYTLSAITKLPLTLRPSLLTVAQSLDQGGQAVEKLNAFYGENL
jgi:hypothetical protein